MLHFDNKLCLPDGVSSKIIDCTLINLIIHEVSLLASFRNTPGFSRNTGILTDEYDNNNKNNKGLLYYAWAVVRLELLLFII